MVKEDLQKYINEESEIQQGIKVIQEYAGTNSQEELAAKVAIGNVAIRYHAHPGLEFYASQDAGFSISAGKALLQDAQRGIVTTAKNNLEAVVSLLDEKTLPGISADVVAPSDKEDERHKAHRKYLEVRNKMVNKEGQVNIKEYLSLFDDDSNYSALIKRLATQEAETEDGKKVLVASEMGKRLVHYYTDSYKREFLTAFADEEKKQIDQKELVNYTVENLKDLPESKPIEVQLKDSIVYTIVKTAVKPEETGNEERNNIVEFPENREEELAEAA